MREHKPGLRVLRLVQVTFALIIALSSLPVQAQTACVQLPSGAVAWWPFDETAGPIAVDLIGGRVGTSFGSPPPVPANGEVGNALRFNGSTDFIRVADDNAWAFGINDFSIELWANFSTPGGGSIGYPSHVFIGNDEGPYNRNKWFFALGGGYLNFHINSPSLGAQFFPLAPFSPALHTWYHLAVTRNGSLYRIYINGTLAASATNTASVPNAAAFLTIGEAEGIGFMNGLLDEVTIYNRALTGAEIAAISVAGSAGKCKTASPDHITIKPVNPMVTTGGSIPFTATVYDAQNNVLPTAVTWSVTNPDAGSISLSGVFKPGTIAGTFENVVTASTSTNSVSTSTSVTVVVPDTTNIIDATYGIGAGSFELGNFVNNGHDYMSLSPDSTVIIGWTVGGPGDGVDWCAPPTYRPGSGSKSVDLTHTTRSSIATTIPTVMGGQYVLSFSGTALMNNGGNIGSVSAGSMVNQTFTVPYSSSMSNQSFAPFSFEFTATEPTTTVRFASTSQSYPNYYGPVVDDVKVVSASALFGGVLKSRRALSSLWNNMLRALTRHR